MANSSKTFCNTAIETGSLELPKMVVTVLKMLFQKKEPYVIFYRDQKGCCKDDF